MRHTYKESILIVDDHPMIRTLLKEIFQGQGYTSVHACATADEAWQQFNVLKPHLVFIDYDLKETHALDMVTRMLNHTPEVAIIMMMDHPSVHHAVEATKRGCYDVLEKPLNQDRVLAMAHSAFEHGHLRTEIVHYVQEESLGDTYYGLVGRSPAIRKIFNLIDRIKSSSVSVLITGPSGSGKEMIAKALHQTSPRSKSKFVAINCSAIPDSLLEGELFGYKKGAFTDARNDKIGLFQEAQKGTLFLDEIGDMPLTVQPKILRALQEKEIRPLGAIQSIQVDVRIIAATNQDLQDRIQSKMFREDLFYRLNAMQLDLPPLKERPEDIPMLLEYFIEKFRKAHGHHIKGVSHKAMGPLLSYSWPGNVRELENIIERAILLSRHDMILPEDLLFIQEEKPHMSTSEWAKRRRPLADIEKDYILDVLQSVGGNRSETANILQIGRKTLYNKLAKYGM